MKKFFGCFLCVTLVATAFGMLVPGAALAQDKDAVGGYKIGVINLALIMEKYQKREIKYAELQKEVDKLQKDIDAMSANIEAAKKKYEEGKDTMSEDARFEMKNKIESDYATYRLELENRQRLIDNMEERVVKELFKEVQAAIEKVATEGNYHLILKGADGPRSGVLYHSATIDITSQVLAALGQK